MARHEPATIAAVVFASTALVFASTALVGMVIGGVGPLLVPSSSAATTSGDIPNGGRHVGPGPQRRSGPPRPPRETALRRPTRGGDEANVASRRGRTVFGGGRPAVANLDRDLVAALGRAATDAASNGIEIVVNSGWRSPEYQEQLLRTAVLKYGSVKNAVRWVATPNTSSHVFGRAVDIGPSRAIAWLSRHGISYGLCQIYENEPWHYELRPQAIHDGCPPMYADPTHDPRMRQ